MIPVVVNLIVVLLVLGVLAGLASQSVRIVREYERLVVFRLRAEGDKQAKILQAEGYAQSLRTVFGAAQQIDSKTMTLQVIDGLKALGASPSSTFVIPMELTRLLGQVGAYLDRSLSSGDPSATAALSNGTEAAAEPLGSRA